MIKLHRLKRGCSEYPVKHMKKSHLKNHWNLLVFIVYIQFFDYKKKQTSTSLVHFLSKLFWYYFLCFQIRYYANSSNTLNLKTPEKSQTVPNYSKILILAKLFQILILTKFFRNPYVNLIRNSLILWSSLNYINILPTSSFSSSDIHQSHILVRCHATDSNSSSFFFYMLCVV